MDSKGIINIELLFCTLILILLLIVNLPKKIKLPESIEGNFYKIIVTERETIVEFNNKKGKSVINPIKLIDTSNKSIERIELYNGRTYLIEKTLVNDNKTNTINQSSILIRQIGN